MDLTIDDFRGRLDEVFQLQAEPSAIELRLMEAEPTGSPRPDAGRTQPFSLVFTGPQQPLLPQAVYRLEHPEMGELDIFLVPIGSDPDGTRYEAVFN